MKAKASPPRIGRAVFAAFLAALILKTFVLDFMIAEGRSMFPTIKPGTVLIINRAAYGLRLPFTSRYLLRWAVPKGGDIVVFPSPVGGHIAVKRCAEQDTAPDGFFVALGDNAEESYDSREYGPIPVDFILGKVMGVR